MRWSAPPWLIQGKPDDLDRPVLRPALFAPPLADRELADLERQADRHQHGEGEEERQRLRAIVSALAEEIGQGGYIVRTVAEGIREEEVRADIKFLHKLWMEVQ